MSSMVNFQQPTKSTPQARSAVSPAERSELPRLPSPPERGRGRGHERSEHPRAAAISNIKYQTSNITAVGSSAAKYLLALLLLAFTLPLTAQNGHQSLRRGDKAYEDRNYEEARRQYESALEKNNTAKGNYNAGNALFEQGSYEDAAKRYEEAAGLAEDPAVRSSAYRNLGDAKFQQEEYGDAVEAYKQSLRINPDDVETKYNLSKALRKIQQQQQQQNQDSNDQDNQNQDQQDDQQQGQGGEGDPQDQESQDQEGQQQQGQPQQGDPDDKPSDQDSPSQGQSKADRSKAPKMSREEALRQLAQVAESEKETMKKLATGSQSGCTAGKDW